MHLSRDNAVFESVSLIHFCSFVYPEGVQPTGSSQHPKTLFRACDDSRALFARLCPVAIATNYTVA